jgi:hypothetical protein
LPRRSRTHCRQGEGADYLPNSFAAEAGLLDSGLAAKESWLGVLTSGRGVSGFLLRTFSSTGFITRYRVTVEGAETHINPEGGESPPPGWLFRTVIKRTDPQELVETVQAAPPNKSFFDYYTAKLIRIRAEEKAKTPPNPAQ